jgi:hypothetical protein
MTNGIPIASPDKPTVQLSRGSIIQCVHDGEVNLQSRSLDLRLSHRSLDLAFACVHGLRQVTPSVPNVNDYLPYISAWLHRSSQTPPQYQKVSLHSPKVRYLVAVSMGKCNDAHGVWSLRSSLVPAFPACSSYILDLCCMYLVRGPWSVFSHARFTHNPLFRYPRDIQSI